MEYRVGRRIIKAAFLFAIGGFCYNIVEILFRGYTHWTMFIVGGLCFYLIGAINEKFPWHMPLISQMVIASFIVTAIEFISGVILNTWLNLGVWDYSSLPYNLLGQISLIFSVGWFFLSVVAIVADDMIRWKLFKEEKPRYNLFYNKD